MVLDKVYGSLVFAADWDIGSFLKNAKTTIQTWGSALLVLLGVIMIIWAGVMLFKKLTATPQTESQQAGWGKIVLLLIIGGGLAIGGFSLLNMIASGGQQTIKDLGEGKTSTILMLTGGRWGL